MTLIANDMFPGSLRTQCLTTTNWNLMIYCQ